MDPINPYRRLAVWEICILILGLVMICNSIYHDIVTGRTPRVELNKPITEIEKELRVELNMIDPLPGATFIGTSDRNNSSVPLSLAQNSYNSTLTMSQIYQFYNEQLVKNGWQFYKEKSVSIWGKDYGAKEFIYKKGEYKATLDYTAPNPDSHQTFVVSTSWGFND